jgi:hypothetical protein
MADYFVTVGGVILQNVLNIRVTRETTSSASNCELILANTQLTSLPLLEKGTVLKVFANKNIATADEDSLIGTYVLLNYEISEDARTIKYLCTDKTWQMLSRIFVGDEAGTVPELVNLIVQRVTQDGSSQTNTQTEIAQTRSDGTAFPSTTAISATKTAYDLLLQLSSTSETGDKRPYIFWFDENEKFYWKYPSDVIEGGVLAFEDADVLEMSFDKPESESVTMVIYDAGLDKVDNSILGFYLKPDAGSIEGKMIYEPMVEISRDIRESLERQGLYAGISNDNFVALCESFANAIAESIVYNYARGLWNANVKHRGQKFAIGGLYTIKGLGITQTLRLIRIVHTMDRGGWVTQLTFEQDPSEL